MTKIKHLLLVCFALACLTAFSGCVTFIRPLSIARKQIGKNVRLIGRWTGKIAHDGKREEQVLIDLRSRSEREIDLSFSGEGSWANLNDLRLVAVTATMGQHNYAIISDDNPSTKGYLVARYEINGDQLVIWMVDGQKVAKLIEKGELKGDIRTDGFIGFKSVVVTDSAQTITRLLKSSPNEELFLRVGEFRRINSK